MNIGYPILCAVKREEAEGLYALLPEGLMEYEKQILDWTLSFYERHGELPRPSRLVTEFPASELASVFTTASVTEPTADVVEQFNKTRLAHKSALVAYKLSEKLLEDGRLPTEADLEDIRHFVQLSDAGVESLVETRIEDFIRSPLVADLGFPLIDNAMGGIHESEFVLIVGRPGMGKTQLALQTGVRAAEAGKDVLFISKEMSVLGIKMRLAGMLIGMDPSVFRRIASMDAETLKEMQDQLDKATKELHGAFDIGKPGTFQNVNDVMGIARSYDLVIIDGLYLMFDGNPTVDVWQQVKTVSNGLKKVANETGTPIIGATQVKRGGTGKDVSDLSYSDALGQDADAVLGIIKDGDDESTKRQLVLAKNRHGPAGVGILVDRDSDTGTYHLLGEIEDEDWDW